MRNLQSFRLTTLTGYLEPHPELFWQGDKAEYRPSGGYARLLTIFKQVRRERNGAVMALDNDDTSSVNASLRGTVVVV